MADPVAPVPAGAGEVHSGPRAQQPKTADIASQVNLAPDHALSRAQIIQLFPIPRDIRARLSFNIETQFTQWIKKNPDNSGKQQRKPQAGLTHGFGTISANN
jgi:hypothetical protein